MLKTRQLIFVSTLLALLSLGVWMTPVKADQFTRPNGLSGRGPLEKVAFIHYRRGAAKPGGIGGGGGKTSCYGFIARGAKWWSPEEVVVNPTNNSSLTESFVTQAVTSGLNEWETYGGPNIFGSITTNYSASAPFDQTDGQNVLTFGPYADPDVIGVTNVWGYFSGPPQTRQLVEWDMVLNTQFNWGDGSANGALMDLQNIVTHELGHSAGMGDLYDAACLEETMFGYSSEGETTKRSLNAGDIKGIQELY